MGQQTLLLRAQKLRATACQGLASVPLVGASLGKITRSS
jgi:hypothetical protein